MSKCIASSENTSTGAQTIEEIRSRKQALRKEIRGLLKELRPEDVSLESKQVWERLFALPVYKNAKSVGLFLSMPKGEIKTDEALNQVVLDGKTLYVPRVGLDFEKCDMDFVQVQLNDNAGKEIGRSFFYKSWPRNKWGIPEPPVPKEGEMITNAKPGDIDLLVVPGCAFDKCGNRLGHGKGYYDRFIAKMRGPVEHSHKPVLVAVGLSPQLLGGDFENTDDVPVVPTSDHDFRMDVVLSPQRTVVLKADNDMNCGEMK
eukprot:CAMPEP_0195523202 /NCGR_PEP_ID=MMETSP0794_2-20130614/22101_1 /TAXON_ID=515487 /ORGANISM="Stephanopyxis turris, Strain CCMP 815" /LENGTH=258 /DNA_ID=CAMNT_0040653127 /DNA_START=259 /DNA_END=1035 /DNA_ORIENTATION=+